LSTITAIFTKENFLITSDKEEASISANLVSDLFAIGIKMPLSRLNAFLQQPVIKSV